MRIKLTVHLDGMLLIIDPGIILYKNKEHEIQDKIVVEMPKSSENYYVRIYLVEDIDDGDVIVVPDIIFSSQLKNGWIPDPSKHSIIHLLTHFEVPKEIENLKELNMVIYNVILPE
jgi:hypothetical protein